MAKIHGFVYIIVGLFVSIASWKLNYEKLMFFLYAGLIFIFVGVVKLGFNLIKSKTTQKKIKPQHQTRSIKYCHRCGATLRIYHRFCSRCGARI